MATSLDLNLLPLARLAGQDQPELPGLFVAEPPRRAARGRGADRLILYLTLEGNAPLSAGKQAQVLERLAKTYFETSGSVTAALRTVAEALNQFLLDRNLRGASTGQQTIGLLFLAVLRGEQLTLAQCGPLQAFLITAARTDLLYDRDTAGRGLGLSRSTPIRFFQVSLQPNDTLILASHPAPTWSPGALGGMHGQGPESCRRRLINRTTPDVNAVLLHARPGPGKLHLLVARPADKPVPASVAGEEGTDQALMQSTSQVRQPAEPLNPPPLPVVQREQPVPMGQAAPAEQATPAEQAAVEDAAPAEPVLFTGQDALPGHPAALDEVDLEQEDEDEFLPEEVLGADISPAPMLPDEFEPLPDVSPVFIGRETGVPAADGPPPGETQPAARRPRLDFSPLGKAAAGVGRPIAGVARRLAAAGKTLLVRMLPGESLLTIPAPLMALIAVAVPVFVVAAATVVYFSQGLAAQSQVLYEQALQSAREAESQADPIAQRIAWETTLNYLSQAQNYTSLPEVKQLHDQAQRALDQLDLIKRANYQPAIIGGLHESIYVSRMVSVAGDLYLLDSNSGNALHALDTNVRGYEIDRQFQCGPNSVEGGRVGPLIDIMPPPPGSAAEMVLLGADAAGNVLSCFLDKPPVVETLSAPGTAANWGKVVGYTVDLDYGHLYVLDPLDRAVWVYRNSNFSATPDLYFSDDTPPLEELVDLASDRQDLYLLHMDGHVTLCNYGTPGVVPTRCADPAPYMDNRPGREKTIMLPANPFGQILSTQPPDPSLYFLEPKNLGIYRFSLRSLVYRSQYLPTSSMPSGQASAFTVNHIDQILFLAIGNQVFYASIP